MHVRQFPSDTPSPRDDRFLEMLFGGVCHHIQERRNETFVQRARRWTEALAFMAALEPRNEQEWLQAADVTTKQFDALHSLELYCRKHRSAKQRLVHATDFVLHATAAREAKVRYQMLRGASGV